MKQQSYFLGPERKPPPIKRLSGPISLSGSISRMRSKKKYKKEINFAPTTPSSSKEEKKGEKSRLYLKHLFRQHKSAFAFFSFFPAH